jgi:negative regulator of flagellin synthesis FlgM
MAMPIDGPKPSSPPVSSRGPRPDSTRAPGDPPGGRATGSADHSDSIRLTPVAESLSALARSLADGPPVDAQRIDAIARAIDEGRYQVDAVRVAQGLLNMERTLDG